jgi:hypothetical protein
VEGQVVRLEGAPRQRRVGLAGLSAVRVVRYLRVEQVTDRESFPFAQVRTHEDAALAHVGAELEQVATLAEFVLTGEEPVEQLLVDGPEPTLDRLE